MGTGKNSLLAITLAAALLSCSSQADKDVTPGDMQGEMAAKADAEPAGKDVAADAADDICVPDCAGKDCGDDGCGGSCGSVPRGTNCVDGRTCCAPDCYNKECGLDGAGGYCGNGDPEPQGCPEGLVCSDGVCGEPCFPHCDEMQCGDDGCGGSCGTCPCDTCNPEAISCSNGLCEIPPDCDCVCVFECFEACDEGDQACYQNCVSKGPDDPWDYPGLVSCLDEAGYFDCAEDDQDCLDEAFELCADEYSDC